MRGGDPVRPMNMKDNPSFLTKMKKGSKGKGRGWHDDQKEHARVGKKGGEATFEEYGEDFYSEIGQMGGEVSPGNFRNNPQRAREAGRKGGKSRGRRGGMR